MNRWFYAKLASTGIKKNKQLYYPYLIAGITMVMTFYILSFLSASDVVRNLPGGEIVIILLQCGSWAIGMFSIPFLFYTNSSLIKRRKKELGLYNILGMNKKNIFYILFWEALITYGISVIGGIFSGVIFSKIAELGLVNIMKKDTNYRVYIEWKSVWVAVLVFGFIFLLILLNMLRQIRNNNPVELLHSESTGEHPPKSSWFLAVVSLIFLVVAYYLAAKMEPPINYGKCFGIAVLITVGTFLLFLCTSVFLCKILQNNKSYYYKTSHFVTVSSMSYRMRRNGVSLASICILVTLILVTLVFSIGFYASADSAIEKHYPYDIGVNVEIPIEAVTDEMGSRSYTEAYRSGIESIVKEQDVQPMDRIEIYSANMLALITDGCLDLSSDMRNTWYEPQSFTGWERDTEKIVLIHVISLADYNKLCETNEELGSKEVLIATENVDYQSDNIVLYDGEEVNVSKMVKKIPVITAVRMHGKFLDVDDIGQMFLVVPDLYSFMGEEIGSSIYAETNYSTYHWEYDISMIEENAEIYNRIKEMVQTISVTKENQQVNCYSKAEKGEKFYGLSGGLLFLALIINIVFAFVTALIMYYKQISEGYEDQKRFAIMRKIGMTKKEIRKSINSQMLTVCCLPLIVAGIHLVFTLQIVYLLLRYVVIDNKPLVIRVMIISFILFGIVYSIVYTLTSRTYLKIVNRPVND